MLQYDVCIGRGDFRAATEVDDNELSKLRRSLSNDMDEEILATGDKENVPHLRHSRQPPGERMDHPSGICLEPDANDRLEGMPHRLGVDVGVEASDHAARDQRPHPAEAG